MLRLIYSFYLYTIVGTIMLALLAKLSPKVRFLARMIAFYLALASCASYGVVVSILLKLLGRASIAQWATGRAFYFVTSSLVGYDFKVDGEEHLLTRPAVFIANHQSEFDISTLGKLFPQHCSVTAKRSLKYIPLLGWFMALSDTVFIDRGNRKSAISAFDAAANHMKTKKQSVWIYPEGTRSYSSDPILLPFKTGAFHLARQAGVPVVPIVIANYSHVFNFKERRFEDGIIPVKVLPPISLDGMTADDMRQLADKTRLEMLQVLEEISPKTQVKKVQ